MKKIILGSVNNAVEILSKTEYPVAIFEIIKTSGENEIIYVPKCNFAEGFQEDKNGFIHLESLLGKVKMFNKNVVRSYDLNYKCIEVVFRLDGVRLFRNYCKSFYIVENDLNVDIEIKNYDSNITGFEKVLNYYAESLGS
jgi:hypothetical protein